MERNETYLWLATIKQAREGDKFAQAQLRIQNEKRAKEGRPTLEEEILASLPSEKDLQK